MAISLSSSPSSLILHCPGVIQLPAQSCAALLSQNEVRKMGRRREHRHEVPFDWEREEKRTRQWAFMALVGHLMLRPLLLAVPQFPFGGPHLPLLLGPWGGAFLSSGSRDAYMTQICPINSFSQKVIDAGASM